ncbi:hypothetical protein [Burkholderia vietnamiensis]|uniref:hypothetical protein n=1 Tax=Burkholderia vietnamiensis TaxID=60552 RepID=UPI00076DAB35|nr:hypothetical protein [Burkholderia vietnamiensis]KVR99567.1 hypothetical protein WK29_30020 [Burkholderia vietnamiensis]MCA7985261.1 hypothetical protein [Burkholderia vietnamiensis]HDR8932998.1 hypothetical protein [Burkholderia vietnamiensis]
MKPLWRDRYEQDSLGQPILKQRARLSWVRRSAHALWKTDNWLVKAFFTGVISAVVAFATAKLAGKNNDAIESSKKYDLHAGVVLLECSPQAGDLLLCKKPVDGHKNSVTSAQSNPGADHDAYKQPASKP